MLSVHLDRNGRARMVDVSAKPSTVRTAAASGTVRLRPGTLKAILSGGLPKGDVLGAARIAGLMAVKRVPDLIPLCHPIPVSGAELQFTEHARPDADGLCRIEITGTVRTVAPTGVEMEALASVCVAALTLYDMCKSMDRDMTVTDVMLLSKSGGRSGRYRRPNPGRVRRKSAAGRGKRRR